MRREIYTGSPEETEAFGSELGELIKTGEVPAFIALYGDLGVGKTAFVRGFVRVFSPNALVRSPTFALVNEYPTDGKSIFHFDMYRIADEDDLYSIGYYDYIDNGICLVEWSENIPYALPDNYLKVTIEKDSLENENSRKITVEKI